MFLIRPQPLAPGQLPGTSRNSQDSALVAAILQGDRKATADFVARCAHEIYSYVRSRLAPRYDQVDDLVQEVFLAALKNLPQYRGEGALVGWIVGIARHKVEDYYRQCLRAPESLQEEEPSMAAVTPLSDLEQHLDRDRQRKKTQQVLQELPEAYRLALLWRYWDKASAREMAAKTGKTEKAIERLLARARAEFRQRWNRA